MRPLITLTTDFGAGSGYAAQVKGVMLSICRELDLIDLSHAVRPQDVRQGAIFLADVTPRFPAGTIHLAVVDPGVGTARRILYAEISEHRYVAPDNGLLSYLCTLQPPRRFISVENPAYWLPGASQTFHGRDIMGPVAAHLANGLDPNQLGRPVGDMVMLPWAAPIRSADALVGEVLLSDSFGNLITNIDRKTLAEFGAAGSCAVEISGRQICGIVATYGSAAAGELIALFDSQDRLEIAQVNGNAAEALHTRPGEKVMVRPIEP